MENELIMCEFIVRYKINSLYGYVMADDYTKITIFFEDKFNKVFTIEQVKQMLRQFKI